MYEPVVASLLKKLQLEEISTLCAYVWEWLFPLGPLSVCLCLYRWMGMKGSCRRKLQLMGFFKGEGQVGKLHGSQLLLELGMGTLGSEPCDVAAPKGRW